MPEHTVVSDDLAGEQAYLENARRELARMRDKTLSARAAGGDRVSDEALALTLHRRAAQLVDDPTTALFFGRLDLTHEEHGQERWYIGRRHVDDERGDPVVIDWRAELSGAFYRAVPQGADGRAAAPPVRRRPRAADGLRGRAPRRAGGGRRGPQPDPRRGDRAAPRRPDARHRGDHPAGAGRDRPGRRRRRRSACRARPVPARPRSGLHRAAWLLYAYRDRLARSGVLVVGPNRAFLDHVSAVLPALGEVEVRHTTAEELVAGDARVRGEDATAVAVLKGDAAAGRGAASERCGRTSARRPRPSWCRAERASGGCPRTASTRSSTELRGADDPLRGRAAGAAAAPRAPRAAGHGAQPGTHRTTGCRTRWRGPRRSARTPRRGVAEARPAAGADRPVLLRRGPVDARVGRADPGRAGAAGLGDAAPVQGVGALVGRRPGPAGRAGRPARAHAEPRPRRPRRGAGPVADAAARGRPAVLDRFGDGARRHRAGDDAVGHRSWAVVAGAPGQAGRAHRDPRPGVPGAGVGHRLRGAAAAVDGARAGRAGLGPRQPAAGSTWSASRRLGWPARWRRSWRSWRRSPVRWG